MAKFKGQFMEKHGCYSFRENIDTGGERVPFQEKKNYLSKNYHQPSYYEVIYDESIKTLSWPFSAWRVLYPAVKKLAACLTAPPQVARGSCKPFLQCLAGSLSDY